MRLIFVLLLIVSAPVAVRGSSPIVSERFEYYSITGSSADELRAKMNQLGPKDSNGEKQDAVTYWDLSWKPRYARSADACEVSSLAIRLDVVVMLPRWSDRQAGTTLVERWDRFMIALKNHEEGHVEIGRRAATTLHERLSKLSGRTCPLLDTLVSSTAHAILDEFDRAGAVYDQQTRHGASQGVRFP